MCDAFGSISRNFPVLRRCACQHGPQRVVAVTGDCNQLEHRLARRKRAVLNIANFDRRRMPSMPQRRCGNIVEHLLRRASDLDLRFNANTFA